VLDTTPLFDATRLRKAMEKAGVDAIVMRDNANSKYLSSFFHNGGNLGYRPFVVFFFLDPAKAPALVVPAVDLHLAMDSSWIEDVRAYAMAEFFTDIDTTFYDDFFAAARSVIADRGMAAMTIGTEGDNLTQGYRRRLEALFPDARFVDFAPAMEIVRMVKTQEEIRRLRRACEITVKAHESFRDAIRVGATDRDLFNAAASRMFAEGADGIHFINVGAGPLGYAAHAPFPTGHRLQKGDFAKVDMGAVVLGYPADFVRSYYLGECSQRQKDMRPARPPPPCRLGVPPRRDRRPCPARLHRDPAGRARRHLRRLPRPRRRLARGLRRRGPAGDDRQRLRLHPKPRLPGRLAGDRRQAPHHPALPPAHQWQGGALHPDLPARVALCQALPDLPRQDRRHARLAPHLQPPPPPRRPPRPHARAKAEQRAWQRHLAGAFGPVQECARLAFAAERPVHLGQKLDDASQLAVVDTGASADGKRALEQQQRLREQPLVDLHPRQVVQGRHQRRMVPPVGALQDGEGTAMKRLGCGEAALALLHRGTDAEGHGHLRMDLTERGLEDRHGTFAHGPGVRVALLGRVHEGETGEVLGDRGMTGAERPFGDPEVALEEGPRLVVAPLM
jgi:hypothetical protein